MLKVGVIIPDRGDRPDFLKHCLSMMDKQTRKPDFIEVVNYEPKGHGYDLTQRVRHGFEKLQNKCDCVLIIENDDWYSPNYIYIMVNAWEDAGMPAIFGTAYTYYYHIGKKEYRKLLHPNRASLMNTLISTYTDIEW